MVHGVRQALECSIFARWRIAEMGREIRILPQACQVSLTRVCGNLRLPRVIAAPSVAAGRSGERGRGGLHHDDSRFSGR